MDYKYARARVRHGTTRERRGYEIAEHFAAVIASGHKEQQPSLDELFRRSVEEWKQATGHWSSITKALAHPSYLRVIGLAKVSQDEEIEQLLLRELQDEPDYWFAALTAITGEDPVKPEDDFDSAVASWIEWGRNRGIIQR